MSIAHLPGSLPAIKIVNAMGVTLLAAIAAGSIDLVYAASFAREGTTMVKVMQSIASGLQGVEAFKGGAQSAVLGGLVHYGILWVVGAVFVAAATVWPIGFQRPLLSGTVLGVGIYVVMTHVVVPLSRAPFRMPSDPEHLVRNLLVHIVGIGVPMALVIVWGLSRPGVEGVASVSD